MYYWQGILTSLYNVIKQLSFVVSGENSDVNEIQNILFQNKMLGVMQRGVRHESVPTNVNPPCYEN